jgi:Tol biopolymer transport system component
VRALAAAASSALVLVVGGAAAGSAGGWIVFARADQQSELFKIRPDGSGLVRLTRNGGDDRMPKWSPDGRRLLAIYDGRIVIRSAAGRLLRRLPDVALDASWSPDGHRIAYLVRGCPDPEQFEPTCADLWVIRPSGTGRRRLAAADVDLTLGTRRYSWAPDSRRIVYTNAGGPGTLVIVSARDGSKRTLRGTRTIRSRDPAWSPDGRRIAFGRERAPSRGYDLYAAAPDGRELELLAEGSDLSRPTWSPDGRLLAYLRSTAPFAPRGERYAVIAADSDGRHARQLGTATDNAVLGWSPDSSRLIWIAFFGQLTTARADGRGLHRALGQGQSPDWG